jgi:hypothetical protein
MQRVNLSGDRHGDCYDGNGTVLFTYCIITGCPIIYKTEMLSNKIQNNNSSKKPKQTKKEALHVLIGDDL